MHLVHPWQKGQEAEAYRYQSLLNLEVNWGAVEKKIRCANNMGQVTKAGPSYYLALLSFGKKTRQQDRQTPWPDSFAPLMYEMDHTTYLTSASTDTTKTLFWSNMIQQSTWQIRNSVKNNGQIEKGMNLTWQHALIPISSLSTYLVSWDNSPVPEPGHNLKW